MKLKRSMSCAILSASTIVTAAQQSPVVPGAQGSAAASQAPVPSALPSATPSAVQAPVDPTTSPGSQPSLAPKPITGVSGQPAAPGADSAHYVIGADDALQITVWREPTLSGMLPVRPDGMISMVLLGDVPAAGMTPTQLSADITQRLHKYFQDPPSVTVQVMGVNSQKIYLIGEVGHVGSVPLSAAMSPLQAIAAAGGLSPFANSKHIYILRGTGPTQQKIPFNYKQALKGDNHQQIVLRPGDTIVVP